MGFLSKVFGSDKTIDAAGNVIEKTGNLFDKLFTSKEEKLNHAEVMERLSQRPIEFAHELNLLEAQGNWFNSGWRPGLGWVCVVALFLFYVPQYAMATVVWVKAVWIYLDDMKTGAAIVLPAYPVTADAVMELVAALLGTAIIRTVEKFGGVAKK